MGLFGLFAICGSVSSWRSSYGCMSASLLDGRTTSFSQHCANLGFEFGRPGRPAVSLFPSLRKEGWSAERRRGVCGTPRPALRRPVARQDSGTHRLRGGWGSRGVRALARGPAPPGAPTRCQLSGTASCSLFERRDRRRSSKEQNKNYIYSYSKAVNPASDCDFGMRRENAQPAPADCGEPSLKTVTVSGDGPRLPLRFPIWIRLEARDRGRAEHAARPGGLRRALIARGPRAGTAQSSHCDALF